MITSLSDWFKYLVPLFQPIRSETKTDRGSHMQIFLHFVSATCTAVVTSSFDWFTGLSPCFLIGQSNYFGLVLRHWIETGFKTRLVSDTLVANISEILMEVKEIGKKFANHSYT